MRLEAMRPQMLHLLGVELRWTQNNTGMLGLDGCFAVPSEIQWMIFEFQVERTHKMYHASAATHRLQHPAALDFVTFRQRHRLLDYGRFDERKRFKRIEWQFVEIEGAGGHQPRCTVDLTLMDLCCAQTCRSSQRILLGSAR